MNTAQNSKTTWAWFSPLKTKTVLALSVAVTGLVSINIFAHETSHWPISAAWHHLLGGAFFSLIAIIGIWLIRKRFTKPKLDIGLSSPTKSFQCFTLGMGLIAAPVIITIMVAQGIGWAQLTINGSTSILWAFLMGFAGTLLTDALPEELIFRGFIFGNFQNQYSKLKSALISVLMFAFFPLVIVAIQKLLNYPIFVGANDHITPSFMITMLFFGSFMQYLRILTGSVWTSIGFHTIFVFMNQLIGTTERHLFQFSDSSNEPYIQALLIVQVVLIFISLIAYPYLAKKPIEWKKKA